MTKHYLGILDIARSLKVNATTVRSWANIHDTPEPDITCGSNRMRGWSPERLEEWKYWYKKHRETRDERKIRSNRNKDK